MSIWQVIVVEGSARDLRAFIAGFVAERRLDPTSVVLGDEVGLERASLGERLHALLHGGHHAVLAPDEVANPLAHALGKCMPQVTLRIVERHSVTAAVFVYEAEAFARDVSTAIRAAVQRLPEGVLFAEHSEAEEEHVENKGHEMFTPVHHYAYRTRGKVVGPPAGVLAVRVRLAEIECVELEPLHLEPAA
jgi:hypothetical protein